MSQAQRMEVSLQNGLHPDVSGATRPVFVARPALSSGGRKRPEA